jgi:hypothetical protein
VELLAALIVAGVGVGVGVAVDSLECPLGILELHLLFLVALGGNLLLAFPLAGRRVITARLLLLLLAELLREHLDLPALLHTVAPRVGYRAPWTALVAVRGLPQPLVTSWAMTPTNCYNSSGSSGQQLIIVVAADLLLLLVSVSVATLSSDIYFRLVGLPCLWGRLGMPYTPFHSPGALVHQAQELRDVLHIVCD